LVVVIPSKNLVTLFWIVVCPDSFIVSPPDY